MAIQEMSTTRSACKGNDSTPSQPRPGCTQDDKENWQMLTLKSFAKRVFSVAFTPDARYLLSGSDDGNVRLWRAKASERSHVRSTRERMKLEYDDALKKRYKHMPEIRRIARHRHIPSSIKKMTETKRIEIESIKRRDDNRRKNQKNQTPRVPERQKMVVKHVE